MNARNVHPMQSVNLAHITKKTDEQQTIEGDSGKLNMSLVEI